MKPAHAPPRPATRRKRAASPSAEAAALQMMRAAQRLAKAQDSKPVSRHRLVTVVKQFKNGRDDLTALRSQLAQMRDAVDDTLADLAARQRDPRLREAYAQADEARAALVDSGDVVPTETMARRLGVTRQALNKAKEDGRMFALPLRGRELHWPAFYADMTLDRRQLEEVTRALGALPPWTKWLFFTRAKGSLGSRTPLQALKEGQLQAVLKTARAAAER